MYAKLEQAVAWWQSANLYDLVDFGDVPGTHDNTTAIGSVFYHIDSASNLVDMATLSVGPFAPLHAVDWPEITPIRAVSRNAM